MKRTIRDADCSDKTVLVRVDFNVPLDPLTGQISDDTRIFASLPTIRYLQQNNCKIILCSHFDRPKGKVVKEMRMFPVAKRLNALLGQETIYVRETIGDVVREAANEMALHSMIDILQKRSINRGLSVKIYDFMPAENATGMSVRQTVNLKEGISKENSKKINVFIKNLKLKVQSQIQGEQVRVTAKKIDDLQLIIEKLLIMINYQI